MTPYYDEDGITIYHGEALDVLASLPDDLGVDLLLTDPPYSSGGMFRGDRQADTKQKYQRKETEAYADLSGFSGDSRDQLGYLFWVGVWLGRCQQLLKPGAIGATFTDWRQLATTTMALQTGGFVYRGVVPWWKPNGRGVTGRWGNQCEYVVWGTNGPRSLDHIGPVAFPGFFQATSVRDRDHIAEKPLSVLHELVKVADGGLVLDPFLGSGTTLRAAKDNGCRAIGIEIEERYCEIAAQRLSQGVLPLEAS